MTYIYLCCCLLSVRWEDTVYCTQSSVFHLFVRDLIWHIFTKVFVVLCQRSEVTFFKWLSSVTRPQSSLSLPLTQCGRFHSSPQGAMKWIYCKFPKNGRNVSAVVCKIREHRKTGYVQSLECATQWTHIYLKLLHIYELNLELIQHVPLVFHLLPSKTHQWSENARTSV